MGLVKFAFVCCSLVPVILVAVLAWSCQKALQLQNYKASCWNECKTFKLQPVPEGTDERVSKCVPAENMTLEDLETKGYTVLRKFLKPSDYHYFNEIHKSIIGREELPPDLDVKDIVDTAECPKVVGIDVFKIRPSLKQKFAKVLAAIHNRTDIRIKNADGLAGADVFFLKTDYRKPWDNQKNVFYDWHQDLEPWYLFQDLYNYVNFYMTLAKENPKKAGLTVVPFDMLKSRSPELHDFVMKRGATEFRDINKNRMQIIDKQDDRQYEMDFHLNKVSCTPDLSPGDVLILRGDAIHRTQVHKSWRVTLSVRIHAHQPIISTPKLIEGGMFKYQRLQAAKEMFKKRLKCSMLEEGYDAADVDPELEKFEKMVKDKNWEFSKASIGKSVVDYMAEYGLISLA
mmetsp:Transcript_72484/g.132731  ORF Transcript_72484/g.132731 Transcript_72484/m.132731 type:complete len:400 (-) Transcript_72484:68-1267(-)